MPAKTPDSETDVYLAEWAEQVVEAVTPDELTRLMKNYRQQARNPRRSAADREFARRRGNALSKFVTRNS